MQFCQLSATSQRGWISFQPWQAKNVHNNCTTEQVSERVVLLYSPRREANAHKTSGWCRPRACFPLATTHCVECYENFAVKCRVRTEINIHSAKQFRLSRQFRASRRARRVRCFCATEYLLRGVRASHSLFQASIVFAQPALAMHSVATILPLFPSSIERAASPIY